MARTDVTEVIERVRRQLNSTVRLEINTLGSTLTTSTNPVTLTYDLTNNVRAGALLAVGTELMRVISVDTLAKECTVLRGYMDSSPEAHASGAEVQINPRYNRFDIFDAILSEIDSWSPDLFTVEDYTATVTGGTTQGIELPSTYQDALGVVSVRRNYTEDSSTVWPEMQFDLHRGRSASLTPNEGTGLFVRITENTGYAKRDGNVAIRIAMPYTSENITEDSDLADTNVTRGLLEVIELGVKARLIADDESGRSGRGIQDEPRRADEVQAGAALSLAQTFLQRYERRRNIEVRRLRTITPYTAW